MLSTITWFLILSLLGWLAFPIAFRFLGKLPDRGFTISRALGLLLWAFAFWILGSYGLLMNDLGGLIVAFLLLIFASYWAWRGLPKGELRAWLRANRPLVFAVELLFLLAFAAMVFYRAANPNLVATEKPMELTFINAILRSPTMPPHDPWLSGYSISYYYFGYVMVAMLAQLSGVGGGVAFNLGVALVFAMAALGAYGLAYNLLSLHRPQARKVNLWAALLAPLFVLLLGNVEGLLEILHARHLFWGFDEAGSPASAFWSWLDVRDLVLPPVGEAAWQPRLYGTGQWWWWRASRVINDINFLGIEQEVISEFPAFSFVLGDLHPHVLSMPFVYLAIALVFNLFLGGASVTEHASLLNFGIGASYVLLSVVVLGGLAFLNIWDFPIYLTLFAGVYTYRRALDSGWNWGRLQEFFALGVVLGVGGFLAYLPFYLGFSSQAGGLLPNLLNPSRGAQLWVMFGTLLLPISAYLFSMWKRDWQLGRFVRGLLLAFGLAIALWLISNGLAWLYATLLANTELGLAILSGLKAPDMQSLFSEAVRRRVVNFGAWLTLVFLLGSLFGRLWPKRDAQLHPEETKPAHSFALLLTLFAALLVLAPEFVYLRDHFGTRMNTVFKFYMQAWLVWGVVAAFGLSVLWSESRALGRTLAALLAIVVLGAGLIYPVYAFSDRARRPEGQALELDGTRYLSVSEAAAVNWLQQAPLAPLAEAVGPQYSSFARYATHSGQQGVLGWPGHESQWRGGSVDFASRIADIERLYSTSDWSIAKEILQKYGIRYVVVGSLEQSAYQVNVAKFEGHLQPVLQNQQVTIYLVPQE